MSTPDETMGTILVIEMKPGWIYVKIGEPKLEPDQIDFLLGQAIKRWFGTHPTYVIDKTQPVTESGRVQGINVWYHAHEQQPQPADPELPRQPQPLTLAVHNQVFQQMPKEHIEAVIDEALQICRSQPGWRGTLVVVTPGRIAVVLDKHVNQGEVLPFELVLPALEDATKKTVEAWLEAPPTRRHVILIKGSWFAPQKIGPAESPIRDDTPRHTNLTYDTGTDRTQ